MKKISNNDGIAPWKIDHPVERLLARAADKSELAKKLYVRFYQVFDRDYYLKGLKFIEKNVKTFVGDVTPKEMEEYTLDMVYSLHRFGCMFDEYFLYHFPQLNVCGRESFITDKYRWDYYERMNRPENKELFNNKFKTYEIFKEFYKREVIEFRGSEDECLMQDFLSRHNRFIVKPIDSSGGKGVFVMDANEYDSRQSLLKELSNRTSGTLVIEELIMQASEMSQLHPESLNTIRVPTLTCGEEVVLFHPYLRIGQGKSVVDNGASGGIICPIDAKTGICIGPGMDEKGTEYIIQPDTGAVIPGFQVPRWAEAISLLKVLVKYVPDNHYTGWDLALTNAGWIMVEANPRGQFGMQFCTGKGVKAELEQYISKM